MKNSRINAAESGWVLVIAIVVMALLLGLGLATLALTDTQQSQSRQQRVREDSFNLAEGMLFSTSQLLARHWPSQSGQAFPDCSQTSTGVALCTDPSTVTAATGASNPLFGGSDFTGSGNVKWTVQVRDNGDNGGNVLSNYAKLSADTTQRKCSKPNVTVANCTAASGTISTCNPVVGTFCTWDFNGDNQVFVRAEGQVRSTTVSGLQFKRRLVALLKLEIRSATLSSNVVQAGWIQSTNNGNNKILVDAQGSGGTASKIILTCNPSTNTTTCPDPRMTSGGSNQIDPSDDYATHQTVTPGMSQDDYDGLQFDHVYNDSTGCPASSNSGGEWNGTILFDFSSSSTVCSVQSNAQLNSPATPGLLVINCGRVQMLGTSDFYGVMYGRNTCNSTALVVDLGGGGVVHGGVTVDNGGGVAVGGKAGSITYDPNNFGGGKVAGTAGLVQSTWRELTPTQ